MYGILLLMTLRFVGISVASAFTYTLTSMCNLKVNSPMRALATSTINPFFINFFLPTLLSSLEPNRVHWILWAYGTTATAAITTYVLRVFKGNYAPWGKTGIIYQTIFSITVGYFYTDLFNEYLTHRLHSQSQKDNLLPTSDQNTLKKFTAELRTTPPEKLETLLTNTPLLRLAGNDMIEILASHLPWQDGHYNISFDKPSTIPPENITDCVYLDQLKKDTLQHLSSFLTIYDLLTLSMSCKKLYHLICGSEGQNLWKSKKVGSITSFRQMTILAKTLSTQTRSSKNITFILHGTLLKQALFLAWPHELIQRIGIYLSTSQDFKEGLSLLWLNEEPHTIFMRLMTEITKYSDKFVAYRFLREHPECIEDVSKFPDNDSRCYNLGELTARFGFPQDALDFYCKLVSQWLKNNHIDEAPLDNNNINFKILQRIHIDHPEYSFEGKLPPAVIPGIFSTLPGKPRTHYLNLEIEEIFSQ